MFNLMNKRLNKKGFTLIELIVVIAIIAILAVILLPRFTGFTEDANQKSAISDARNILLAAQALDAQGQTPTLALINDYLGTSFAAASLTLTDIDEGDFVYTLTKNTKTYTVNADNWVLTTVTGSATGATPRPIG